MDVIKWSLQIPSRCKQYPDLSFQVTNNCRILEFIGLPRWFWGKESACQCRRHENTGSIPGLRRSPGGEHGNPLQYPCLENPIDRGVWWATVHWVTKTRTWLNWLSIAQQRLQTNGTTILFLILDRHRGFLVTHQSWILSDVFLACVQLLYNFLLYSVNTLNYIDLV